MPSPSRRTSIGVVSHSNVAAQSASINNIDAQQVVAIPAQIIREETLSNTFRELYLETEFRSLNHSKTTNLAGIVADTSPPVAKQDTGAFQHHGRSYLDKKFDNSSHLPPAPRISMIDDEILGDGSETGEQSPLLNPVPVIPNPIQVQLNEIISTIPAIMLGLLLTLLDAVSYGIIIFPANDPHLPTHTAQAGISMFLASTTICQLVFSLGGSSFNGAVGSMMIEVMPFLHMICYSIESKMVGESDHSILATIMAAYAMSTVLTGIVFLLIGVFKLGSMIHFFPRHILIGCIGGIGLFLLFTAVEVMAGIEPNINFEYFVDIFRLDPLKLWGTSLAIAILLKLIQKFIRSAMVVPLYYVVIPAAFYAIVLIAGVSSNQLREQGWLFKFPDSSSLPFYTFWTYYDFSAVNWPAVLGTLPTMLALSFFGILHVPINVPALAVSTHQDVDLSAEILGHGVSNIMSGLMGTTQNYLTYSNSLLFVRTGGSTPISSFLLFVFTGLIWVKGNFIISYIPKVVVGALIFHLGIDLIKESLWDTLNTGMHPLEYFTIIVIVCTMAIVGFTEGIIVGTLLACVFFGKEFLSSIDVLKQIHNTGNF